MSLLKRSLEPGQGGLRLLREWLNARLHDFSILYSSKQLMALEDITDMEPCVRCNAAQMPTICFPISAHVRCSAECVPHADPHDLLLARLVG